MLPIHIALVPDHVDIPFAEVAEVAAALQKQILRDFSRFWMVAADVTAFAARDTVPLDYWQIRVTNDINDPRIGGIHETEHGQPFALVKFGPGWSLTASHELLEMLGDPFGRRFVAGPSPVASQGRVNFLVEVCDPCEGPNYAYEINSITVSDFYTPRYFDPARASGVQYSFTGSITEPRQVLRDGYLSWYAPSINRWGQRTWFDSDGPSDNIFDLPAESARFPRQAIDRMTAEFRASIFSRKKKDAKAKIAVAAALTASARTLDAQIKHIRSDAAT
jgi:hypothetical protein